MLREPFGKRERKCIRERACKTDKQKHGVRIQWMPWKGPHLEPKRNNITVCIESNTQHTGNRLA